MESILVFSLADVSTTCNTSGRYWQRASASPFSTSLRFSKSHLLPIGFSLLIVNVYYNLKKKINESHQLKLITHVMKYTFVLLQPNVVNLKM